MFFVIAKYYIFSAKKLFNGYVEKIDSDIELGSMKQFSASLLAKDNTPDASNWTSEFAGRWESYSR